MFCTKCGNELSQGAIFCGSCGANVGGDATPGTDSVAVTTHHPLPCARTQRPSYARGARRRQPPQRKKH